MVAVLLSVTGGSAYLGAAVVARHRAQAAADLAALAAASDLAAGPETACEQARAVARQMRVSTTSCAVEDLDVVVTTETRLAVGGWANARAGARAGPADKAYSPAESESGSSASASSVGVGNRKQTSPANVLCSTSTRFTVTCIGTQSPS
jgi:secretion/DNA translocation related TadE-like protein